MAYVTVRDSEKKGRSRGSSILWIPSPLLLYVPRRLFFLCTPCAGSLGRGERPGCMLPYRKRRTYQWMPVWHELFPSPAAACGFYTGRFYVSMGTVQGRRTFDAALLPAFVLMRTCAPRCSRLHAFIRCRCEHLALYHEALSNTALPMPILKITNCTRATGWARRQLRLRRYRRGIGRPATRRRALLLRGLFLRALTFIVRDLRIPHDLRFQPVVYSDSCTVYRWLPFCCWWLLRFCCW